MTREQNMILWIGLALVGVYLFTDVTVRNMIFNRKAAPPTTTAALTLADFTGIPSSVGNTQSSTNNLGTAQTTITLV